MVGTLIAGRDMENEKRVSSNPWDAIGAKAVGLKVAWIEREAMATTCRKCDLIAPLTMFKALRMQMDDWTLCRTIRSMGFWRFLISSRQTEISGIWESTAVDWRIGRRHSGSTDQ